MWIITDPIKTTLPYYLEYSQFCNTSQHNFSRRSPDVVHPEAKTFNNNDEVRQIRCNQMIDSIAMEYIVSATSEFHDELYRI